MKQRNLFSLYLARTAVMLSGARRVALLLLLTLLTTATAWADPATVTKSWENGGTVVTLYSDGEVRVTKKDGGDGAMTDSDFGWHDEKYDGTHYYCELFKTIIIEEGVTAIGELAFTSCPQLTSVTIGSSLTPENFDSEHANSAFTGCVELAEFIVPAGHQSFTSVDGVLYCNEGKTLFSWPRGKTSCTIPDGVTAIADYAFTETKITSVTLPNSVTTLGDKAFSGCTEITEITLPNSVTSIGQSAFMNCTGLTSVTFASGSKLKTIGESAFYGCRNTNLTSIEIPSSVTTIGESAFNACTGLASITFASGSQLTTIGESAFFGCSNTNLTSIEIPSSVTSIGEYNQEIKGVTNVEIIPVSA